jgi:hypothetical protein
MLSTCKYQNKIPCRVDINVTDNLCIKWTGPTVQFQAYDSEIISDSEQPITKGIQPWFHLEYFDD